MAHRQKSANITVYFYQKYLFKSGKSGLIVSGLGVSCDEHVNLNS